MYLMMPTRPFPTSSYPAERKMVSVDMNFSDLRQSLLRGHVLGLHGRVTTAHTSAATFSASATDGNMVNGRTAERVGPG
jgi:hypothetical protein